MSESGVLEKTTVEPEWMGPLRAELEPKATDELQRLLVEDFDATVMRIKRMAATIRIMEERGEEIKNEGLRMIQHLRAIAHGRMMPELVCACLDKRLLLNAAASLPLPDQKRIADDERIKVVVVTDEGTTYRKVRALAMSAPEIRQVLDTSRLSPHIRSEAEQVSWLNAADRRTPKPVEPVVVVAHPKGIRINGAMTISRAEWKRWDRELDKL